MATRAGISETVFREVFRTPEDCYRASYEQGLTRLALAVADAAGRAHGWLDRVRAGLVALLGFFDDEPGWARVLLLDGPVDGTVTCECRQRLNDLLGKLLEDGEDSGDPTSQDGGAPAVDAPMPLPALTVELIAGGVFSVIRGNVLGAHTGKLVELAPSLIAFVGIQCGRPTATGELGCSSERARARDITRSAELPIRATRRTTMVLCAIARAPYSNNREVAQAAGVADEGQTSKLLTRLERKGVIENVGIGAARGEPNAWLLTASGRRAVELLAGSVSSRAGATRVRSWGVA